MKVCPICDTENKPQATHCEVCGERLAPPGPGESVAPEENVLAQLQAVKAEPVAPPAPVAPKVEAPRVEPPKVVPPKVEPARVEPAVTAPRVTVPVAAPVREAVGSFVPDPEPPAPRPVAPPVKVEAPAPVASTEATTQPAIPAAISQRPRISTADNLRIVSSGIPDARLVVYQNKQPSHTHPIVNDETLIGRYDPVGGSFPDLDLTEFDNDSSISRKHAYIYRQNREYFLYPVSNGGTQLNNELVDMGSRRKLKDGDVIILAARLAMKFHIDA